MDAASASAEATRVIFWQIPLVIQIALYLVSIVAVLLIGYAVYKRYQLWMVGKPDNRFDKPAQQIGEFIKIGILDGFLHRRLDRKSVV